MKITVNYIRVSGLMILGGLGLSGCAPIPQAYPTAPQHQYQAQAGRVPQAAPLLPGKQPVAPTAQRYAATPQRQAQPAVPPTIQPAQQQAQARQQAANRATVRRPAPAVRSQPPRPAAANTYRRPVARKPIPPVAPANKRKKPVAPPPVLKKKVIQPRPVPVPPPVQSRPQPQQVTTAQKKPVSEVEVLDMSSAAQKPVSSTPVVEKVVPAPSYNGNPAVVILTKQANNQLVAGKTDRAASTLERALRIAPENPMLWLRLAEVNEQQGKKEQAASMAKKAIGLAPGDANIKQRGSRLIN